MKHSLILMASLLAASVTLHTMEITKQDFVLKQKNYGLNGYFYPTQDTSRLLFSFATTKDLNRSFTNHELLWSSKCKELPQDIKNEILKIRYHQIMGHDSNQLLCKFLDTDNDIFWFNKSQQKVLYSLMTETKRRNVPNNYPSYWCPNNVHLNYYGQHSNLVIEGSNIKFSQEMTKQIDSFPKKLKQWLVTKLKIKNHYYVQTSEPSFLNAFLGNDPQVRRTNANRIAKVAGYTAGGLFFCSGIYGCSKIENQHTREGAIVGAIFGSAITGTKITGDATEEATGKIAIIVGELTTLLIGAVAVGIAILTMTMIGASIAGIAGSLEPTRGIENAKGMAISGAVIIGSIATVKYINNYINTKFNPNNTDELMALRGFEKKYFFPELEDNHQLPFSLCQ